MIHGSGRVAANDAYTTRGQLSTLTGPGGKVWDVDYRADGQPTNVTLPNGMYTGYAYDARGRMTSIAHKTASAGSTLESYGYTMA